jgi:hypothetical protein
MRKIAIALVILTINIAHSQMLAQSAWTRNKGGFYAKTGFFTVGGSHYYDVGGRLTTDVPHFSQRALMLYGEYGINRNLTAILNYPYYKFQNYENFDPAKGIGDPQIELKYALFRKFPVVAMSIGAEVPLAKQTNLSYSKTLNDLGQRDAVNLPTGDGDWNVWSTLAVSSGFWKGLGWGTVWGQYNLRTEGYANQVRLGIELGYKWTSRFWTNARLVGLYQMSPKNNGNAASLVNGQGTQWTTLNIGAAFEIVKHWSLTLDWQTYNDLLAKRKNVYSTPLFQVGVSAEY